MRVLMSLLHTHPFQESFTMNALPARFPAPTLLATLFAPLLALSLVPNPAHALASYQTVWSESFNDIASFEGSPISTVETSEYWGPTQYYNANIGAHDWTFHNGAFFATNGGNDGAILLNEAGPSGASSQTEPLASIQLTGLIVGYRYAVNYNYWGDNYSAPGNSYDLTMYLNGQQVQSLPTDSVSAGSLTAPHYSSYFFTATTTTIDLGFGQIATGGTSPIVDNLFIFLAEPYKTQDPLHSIPAVPEPNTVALMLLGGLIMAARWVTTASRRKRRGE
jgi:hypothetical protein